MHRPVIVPLFTAVLMLAPTAAVHAGKPGADPSLPPGAWSLIDKADDDDPVTPGVQVGVYGLPAVGTGYFYQVTASDSTCSIEGPLLSINDSTLSGGQR